jgi:hypothetical protein
MLLQGCMQTSASRESAAELVAKCFHCAGSYEGSPIQRIYRRNQAHGRCNRFVRSVGSCPVEAFSRREVILGLSVPWGNLHLPARYSL